jgi:hypothetical protein
LIVNDLKTGAQGRGAVALWLLVEPALTFGAFVRSHYRLSSQTARGAALTISGKKSFRQPVHDEACKNPAAS